MSVACCGDFAVAVSEDGVKWNCGTNDMVTPIARVLIFDIDD